MSESMDTTRSSASAVALLAAAAILSGGAWLAGPELADKIWHAQQGMGMVGAVLFEPLAYLVEGYACALAAIFALAFLLQCRSLVDIAAATERNPLRAEVLLAIGLLGMQTAAGFALLMLVSSAMARLVASPIQDPVAYLATGASILLVLGGPLTWAARHPKPGSRTLKAMAALGRGLALVPTQTDLARVLAQAGPAILRSSAATVVLSVALGVLAVYWRWTPSVWEWMPATVVGEPGQLIPDHYAEQRLDLRRPRPVPFIPAVEIRGQSLAIFYPYDPLYHPYALTRRCPDLPPQSVDPANVDSRMSWRGRLLACLSEVHVLKLNGSVIGGSEWRVATDPDSGQRGFLTLLGISGLGEGGHVLQIERPRLQQGVTEPDPAPYEIPFWRAAPP